MNTNTQAVDASINPAQDDGKLFADILRRLEVRRAKYNSNLSGAITIDEIKAYNKQLKEENINLINENKSLKTQIKQLENLINNN
jgi:hypothetical protein